MINLMHTQYTDEDLQPNIVNVNDVKAFTMGLIFGKRPHVAEYVNSTLYRWLQTHDARCVVQCVDSVVADSPVYKMLSMLVKDREGAVEHVRVKQKNLPDWGKEALANNNLWWWKTPGTVLSVDINHWIDFLQTLPERQIRYTVRDLISAVKEWDKQLARQKLIGSLAEGVEYSSSPNLESYQDGDYYVVKLVTKAAYAAEGAVMKNCVAGYHNRSSTEVYSLRRYSTSSPTATIEVSVVKKELLTTKGRRISRPVVKTVVQVKLSSNITPTEDVLKAIEVWGKENNVVVNVLSLLVNKGHYYGDEAECEGDYPVPAQDDNVDYIPAVRRRRRPPETNVDVSEDW